MNRLRRILTGAAVATIISITMAFPAFAARIAFSDPSAETGNEVTVNMKITAGENENINSSNVMLSYDPQSMQFIEGTGATGDAGSIRVVGEAQGNNSAEMAFTLKFRALKPGSTTITVSTQEVYNRDGQIVNVGQVGSSTVTITGEAVAGASADLADLQISPGTLSPAFSPETDSYTVMVGGDVDTVMVSASPADTGASVAVSGNEGLQMGDNEVLCVVTAADGQTAKTYRIMVTKVEGEVGDGIPIADQVSLRTYDRTVTVLSSEEGMEVPEGFVQCSVNIDGQAVRGWIRNDQDNSGAQPEYCIFYAANEEGVKGFYRYDLTEKTIQRYFQDSEAGLQDRYNATAEEYNSLLHDYEIRFWIIMGLIALSVVLLIVIIVLVAGRGQRDDFIEKREDDDGWGAGKRPKRQNLSREEQYLRDLEEEEEEAEREDDLAFIRRVQADKAGRDTRGQSFSGGQGPRPGTQAKTGGRGYQGNVQRGGQGGSGTRGGQMSQARQVSGGSQAGAVSRQGQTRSVGSPGGRGAAQTGNGAESRGTVPSQGGRPSDTKVNAKPAGKNVQADDDFEVIDLE